jgi:predicted dehydrogenase
MIRGSRIGEALRTGPDEDVRVGIVGVGVGARYAAAFQRQAHTEVVALCASTENNLKSVATKLGIEEIYTDIGTMIDSCDLDLIVIATPNDLHHHMTLRAVSAGVHVMCDKPLAMNAKEGYEMWSQAEARPVRHMVPFWWLFLPAFVRAHELIEAGALGTPWFIDVRYLNRGWGDPHGPMRWQFDRTRAGAGALANIGSHAIAVLLWLGGDLVRVSAQARCQVTQRQWPDGTVATPDVEDTVVFSAEMASGALVAFLASSVAHVAGSSLSVAVHGSEGSLTVAADTHGKDALTGSLVRMRRGAVEPERDRTLEWEQAGSGPAAAVDRAFLSIASKMTTAARLDRPTSPSFEDGVRVQEALDAVLASTRGEGWVNVVASPKPRRPADRDVLQ